MLLAGVLFVGAGNVFSQGTIKYVVEDLGDVAVGEDLWRYSFYLSGFNFQANEGLSIFFDYQLYSNLSHPSQPSLDPVWNVLVVQPDVLLTDNGFFDALATANGPSLAQPFLVDAVWLGGGGSQPGDLAFYTYDSDFQVLSGGTTSLVPEPRAWQLALLAVITGLLVRWRGNDLRARLP